MTEQDLIEEATLTVRADAIEMCQMLSARNERMLASQEIFIEDAIYWSRRAQKSEAILARRRNMKLERLALMTWAYLASFSAVFGWAKAWGLM